MISGMNESTLAAVVVHDPTGRLLEGHVLWGQEISVAESRGLVLVYATKEHVLSASPVGGRGYQTQKFGAGIDAAGVERNGIFSKIASFTILTSPGKNRITWAAKVAPYMSKVMGRMKGQLAFTTIPFGNALLPSVRTTRRVLLDDCGPDGEQWVTGACELDIEQQLFVPIVLQSSAQGAKLLSLSLGLLTETP